MTPLAALASLLLHAAPLAAVPPPAAVAPPAFSATLVGGRAFGMEDGAPWLNSFALGVFRPLGDTWSVGPEVGFHALGERAQVVQLAVNFRARFARGPVRPYAVVGPAIALLPNARASAGLVLGLDAGVGLELHPHAGPFGYVLGARVQAGLAPGAYDSPAGLLFQVLHLGLSFH